MNSWIHIFFFFFFFFFFFLALEEILTASFAIWTQIAESIAYDDNRYTMSAPQCNTNIRNS